MKKYEPNYVDDELAIQGWESAALFVQGVKMAGNNLTQANVIKEDNSLTCVHRRRADRRRRTGRMQATRGHKPPYCTAYIKVSGDKYVPTLEQGQERLRVLRLRRPEEEPRLPLAGRDPRPRLTGQDNRRGLSEQQFGYLLAPSLESYICINDLMDRS